MLDYTRTSHITTSEDLIEDGMARASRIIKKSKRMKNLEPWAEIIIAVAVPVLVIAFGVMLSVVLFT